MLSRTFRSVFSRLPRYTFATEISTKVEKPTIRKEISQYKDGQIVTKSAIVLKKEEDIEQYVINVVRNYFRTLNKAAVKLDSQLKDHGLDSLDSIEISMQVAILEGLRNYWKNIFYV